MRSMSALSDCALLGVGALAGEPCREALQLDAQLEDLDDVGHVQLGHERAATRQDDDEVLPREAPQRAAHGREPDAELGCERCLVDGRAGRQRERRDALADAGVGDVAERLGRRAAPLARRARRRRARRTRGPPGCLRLKFHRQVAVCARPPGGQAAGVPAGGA